ncbi:hypothetical protein FRB97_004530 [Tulasnella sp. 331]|nr:hypothetical protein FRB97_004530 [Tulasnella sp. 331]
MLRVKERDKIPRYDAALDTRQSTEPVFRFVSTSGHVNGSEISFISPLVLQSRALTRYQRFEQNGSLTDLDTSIHCFEAAENIAVLNDRLRHISRHKHAVALLARFRKTKTVRDLNNATTRLKELSKIQPEALRCRYALTKKQVDLDDASGYEREGQDLYWSEKGKPSSVQKPFINSRIVTLTVQSLDRYSLTIQIDVTNSIGQLMEMILDKTGACEGVRGLFYKGRVLSSGWTIADCIPDPKYIIYLVYSRSATATQTNAIEDTRVLFFANPARIPQSQDAKGTLRIMDPHRTISVDADLVTPGVARENMDRSNSEETLQVKVVRLLEMGFSSKREAALALVAAAHDFETAIEFLLNGIPEGRKAAAELYVAIRGGLDSIMGETTMRIPSFGATRAGERPLIMSSWENMDGEGLDTKIGVWQTILGLVPPGYPGRSGVLNNLGVSGDRADLETAIKYFEEALQLRPPGHPDRPCSLGNLASGLNSRFEHSGDRADLETAIRLHEEALKLHPPGHPLRSPSLINLAGTIMCRFHQSGDRADAETATRYFEEALRLLPPGHCHRSPSLSHLAVAISRRFQQSGDHADLETAIRLHEEALRLLLPGHPDRPSVLVNLGSAVVSRFQQSGDRTDLSMAIRYFEETLQLCPPGHRIRSAGLNNLATVIQYGFHQAGNPAHVEMAIRFNEEVLQLRPPGHPDRSCSLNNLAGSLNSRFYQSKDREDLEAAIKLYEEALQLLPPGHEDRPFSLINLAMAISYPFDQSRDHADLERAIRLHEEALKLLPPPHPDRSCSLGNLANVILTLFGRTRARSDLDRAMSLMEEACSSEHGNLEARFVVSWNWTRCSLQHAHPSVLKSFTAALELLDTLVTMSSSLDSRYRRTFGTMLVQPESLASDAAAVALYLDQPRRAVELLEQGRGILLAQLARYRTALDDLRAVCPEIATEFTELSSQLEESVSRRGTDGMHGMLGTSKPDLVGRHQNLSRRWNDTISRIRALDGFSSFLKPPPFHSLLRAADEGPVVIVNISEIRSDAIILRNNATPEIVSLPGATHEEISRIASMMDHAVRAQDEGRPQGEVDEVLRLLWGCVVQPVVERLESLGVVRGSHIWWCPTSKLCSLPLHAAGIYRPKQPRLPDMFFSSYISTLSSLIRARSGPSGAIGRPSILAIGVPQPDGTDGADGALHFVDAELQKLLDRAPDVELVKGQDATHDAVSKQLPVHSWVHFSCHGHQDKTQPFNSRFRLQDKPLTLQEVVRMHLPNAELAFLSACHTAAGDWNTPDERLHLAAGMQFSGFRGVVGTLWAMDDIDGPDVAESFYGYMFRNGEEGANYKDAAKGVHEMSKALRRKKVPLDRWINFIHVGA